MTDADDTISDMRDADDVDTLVERLLAGDDPTPGAPAWCSHVALLVRAARAPAGPDELAGEDDIVRRMGAVRLAVLAGDDVTTGADPTTADPTTADPAVPAATGPDAIASVTHLGDHRARHGRDRTYVAKHAAARLEASSHPAVRTLGRVIAMKAAAVTTVAVIGVTAAAAATTGIVATVVVPALSSNEPRKADPVPVTTERPGRPGTTQGTGDGAPSSADELLPPVACPMLPACAAPLTPAGPPQATATTTVPSTTVTTGAGGLATTSETTTTTAAPAPSTTLPGTTTTVPKPPSTTTVPEGPAPDPLVTPLSAPDDGQPGGSTTSAPIGEP